MIPKITVSGYGLMTGALSGATIEFTKIVIGNGEVPDDYRMLNDLQNQLLAAEITEIKRDGNFVILSAPIFNTRIEGRLSWTEMGVFAKNPAGGDDILYGYAHSKLSGDGKGISIPEYNTNLIELVHRVYVYVGEVENVSAVLAHASDYALDADLKEHTQNTSNPHKVSKEDIDLGNVPNVSTNDQTPTYTTPENLQTPESGEKLSTAFGKIRRAIMALIVHLGDYKNPHKTTVKDIGAAEETHTHSTNDINSGILGIARGGTGASTAADARKNLGAAPDGLTYSAVSANTMDELDTNLKIVYQSMKDQTSRYVVGIVNGTVYDIRLWRVNANYGTVWINNYSGYTECKKSILGGVWHPWEYVSPPMILGVEYRTTERWKDSPVYTKLVDFGTLPNCATKKLTHGINAKQIIRAEGQASNGQAFPIGSPQFYYISLRVGLENIEIYTDYNYSACTATVRLWYTK